MDDNEASKVFFDDALDRHAAFRELRRNVLRKRLAVDARVNVFVLAWFNREVAASE
ncbi:hypothetical protein [Acidovorax sp. BL-A-41-H1]|uniref:hypothetical protein n=1 Tax=Acidovorax sp. BL-A-41-H1 TaxID=3421102 RepID=UPI003F79CBC5